MRKKIEQSLGDELILKDIHDILNRDDDIRMLNSLL